MTDFCAITDCTIGHRSLWSGHEYQMNGSILESHLLKEWATERQTWMRLFPAFDSPCLTAFMFYWWQKRKYWYSCILALSFIRGDDMFSMHIPLSCVIGNCHWSMNTLSSEVRKEWSFMWALRVFESWQLDVSNT